MSVCTGLVNVISETGVVDTVTSESDIATEGQVEQFVSVAETVRPSVATTGKPRVVIVGGGFAGLNAARGLKDADVRITLVDRRNHHLFAPLLYQVATAQLSEANIAQPIRSLLKKQKNTSVVLGEVTGVDVDQRQVTLDSGQVLPYDYLIMAVGATHSYFGKDEWASVAPGMKTLDDAVALRRKILLAFEKAEQEQDPQRRAELLTFVVIGGGPTGVELAGAIGEIAQRTLVKDFKNIDSATAKVYLLEALPRILPMFSEKLSGYATQDLAKFGVEVKTGSMVTGIDEQGVTVGDEHIAAQTVIWAAGVQVSPLTRALGEIATLDRAGRVPVEKELHVSGHPEIFVIGDAASVLNAEGKPVPGIAPAAMQQGSAAAANIVRATRGEAYQPFVYQDKGSMATIGRNEAIVSIKGKQFHGTFAWLLWMLVHLAFLQGFKNRFMVLTQWISNYVSHARSSRLITGSDS